MNIDEILYPAIILLASGFIGMAIEVIWLKAQLREEEATANRDSAEKDRIIDSVLKESNDRQALWLLDEKGLVDDIDRLKDILIRVHPYSRLIIHDTAKLEAWLEKLKGKKGAKRHKPGSFQTGGFKDMVHETIKQNN